MTLGTKYPSPKTLEFLRWLILNGPTTSLRQPADWGSLRAAAKRGHVELIRPQGWSVTITGRIAAHA